MVSLLIIPDFWRVVDRITTYQQDSFGIRSSIHSRSKGRDMAELPFGSQVTGNEEFRRVLRNMRWAGVIILLLSGELWTPLRMQYRDLSRLLFQTGAPFPFTSLFLYGSLAT
jgi:hypothetical protein